MAPIKWPLNGVTVFFHPHLKELWHPTCNWFLGPPCGVNEFGQAAHPFSPASGTVIVFEGCIILDKQRDGRFPSSS